MSCLLSLLARWLMMVVDLSGPRMGGPGTWESKAALRLRRVSHKLKAPLLRNGIERREEFTRKVSERKKLVSVVLSLSYRIIRPFFSGFACFAC